jgi:type II secretory pathway component PulC
VEPNESTRIDRKRVRELVSRRAELARYVRLLRTADGRVTAELRGVDPASIPFTLGFRSGDRVQSVNGIDVTTTEGALRVYQLLHTADHLAIGLERAGQSTTLDVMIE